MEGQILDEESSRSEHSVRYPVVKIHAKMQSQLFSGGKRGEPGDSNKAIYPLFPRLRGGKWKRNRSRSGRQKVKIACGRIKKLIDT